MARGRPRKSVPEVQVEDAVFEEVGPTTAPSVPTADDVLEGAKGRFDNLVVVGILPDGNLDVTTTNPNYVFLQYALNKAVFELFLHEKQTRQP